jgi:hypothetical protein
VLPEEQARRPGRRHDGAASVVAARPPSRSCTGEEAASCSRPSGQAQHGGDVGVAAAFQPTRRRGEHHKHRRARTGAPAKLAGVDQAAWARSAGAELDGDGGDWRRGGVTKPHGQEEERNEAKQICLRAAADLAGARRRRARGSSVIRESPEGN